jgi:hypothetical protein
MAYILSLTNLTAQKGELSLRNSALDEVRWWYTGYEQPDLLEFEVISTFCTRMLIILAICK